MAEPTTSSYETRLNILHGPLELIDIKAMAETCEYKWFNQTLCQVNSSVVRVGIIEGEYHWHKHDEEDEFFYVVEGRLLIDLTEKTIDPTKTWRLINPWKTPKTGLSSCTR